MWYRYAGYEVATEGDAFIVVFHNAVDALNWAMHVQLALLDVAWPQVFAAPDSIPACSTVSHNGQVVLAGLRVRMGVESGPIDSRTFDELSGRVKIHGAFLAYFFLFFFVRLTEKYCFVFP
jgi:class 3 adenylate cyclase